MCTRSCCPFFFFNDTATTEIYTLSLHDALPISRQAESTAWAAASSAPVAETPAPAMPSREPVSQPAAPAADRKSTRLNSSHLVISYAVFCLKKKKVVEAQHADRRLTTTGIREPP